MRRQIGLCIFLCGIFIFVNASAQIEKANIVINQTQSPIGEEFYRLFYQQWELMTKPVDTNIVIVEEISSRWGSIAKIYSADDYLIYTTNRLTRRITFPELEDEVKNAMEYVEAYLASKKDVLNRVK